MFASSLIYINSGDLITLKLHLPCEPLSVPDLYYLYNYLHNTKFTLSVNERFRIISLTKNKENLKIFAPGFTFALIVLQHYLLLLSRLCLLNTSSIINSKLFLMFHHLQSLVLHILLYSDSI